MRYIPLILIKIITALTTGTVLKNYRMFIVNVEGSAVYFQCF